MIDLSHGIDAQPRPKRRGIFMPVYVLIILTQKNDLKSKRSIRIYITEQVAQKPHIHSMNL